MKISFRNRNLGYPLLTPAPLDYTGGSFDIAKPEALRNSGGVSLKISYQLESAYLNGLVAQGDAAFQTLIEAGAAFLRETTPPTALPVQQHTLDLGRYAGAVEMQPFLTATRQITGFICDEHHQEFREIQPEGFTIEPAMILAVGKIHAVDLDETANASSVVDFQPRPEVERGQFQIDWQSPNIIVYLSPDDFQPMQGAVLDSPYESRRQVLWPSLYLLALIEGIRNLPEGRESGYAWTAAFERALRQSEIDPENAEDLDENALQYAQKIIYRQEKNYPLGLMLDAFAEEDGNYQDGGSDE